MVFRRFYDKNLAQASYLIGCPSTGEAVIVDPNRDFDLYLEAAQAERLRISAVTETHIHADYLSGSLELAKMTGAKLYLSGEGGPDWRYGFAEDAHAELLFDGDSFRVGGVLIEARHTPGHTPEHLTFMITDTAASPAPMMALTGDFIFSGDVGRPDLLETAAGFTGTMEPGARDLFRSMETFKMFPEYLMLWPGHGAGSACGKALGGNPVTTLGYELRTNWAMRAATEASFVQEVLSGQPEPPSYFAMMKKLNREGPPIIGKRTIKRLTGANELAKRLKSGTVIDLRIDDEFRTGFIKGSLNIPEAWNSFVNYAGWTVPFDRPIVFIAEDAEQAERAAKRLSLIGLDDVQGWFSTEVLHEWVAAGHDLDTLGVAELSDPTEPVSWVDVRSKSEWSAGNVPGSLNVTLGRLRDDAGDIPRGKAIGVYCQSGGRSAVAASILKALGFEDVRVSPDGYIGYLSNLSQLHR